MTSASAVRCGNISRLHREGDGLAGAPIADVCDLPAQAAEAVAARYRARASSYYGDFADDPQVQLASVASAATEKVCPSFVAATSDWNHTWSSCASKGPIIMNGQMVSCFGKRWTSYHWDSAQKFGAIGFTWLGVNRFCALERTTGGHFVTRPLVWPGGELVVSADVRESFTSHPACCGGELAWKCSMRVASRLRTGVATGGPGSAGTPTAAEQYTERPSGGPAGAAWMR
ncbi:MAG: hypothetical protein H5T86_12860 [Armatimonadetes bacterium]|nr:hypothetical protein [Armatimonadota bacterium]